MNDDGDLQKELRAFLTALQDNRSEVTLKLKELDTKLDGIAPQLEALRREQRDSSDQLRREFQGGLDTQRRELQSYFVAKAEFMPYQQGVYAKLSEYDNLLAESRKNLPQYYQLLNDVQTLKDAQGTLAKRNSEVVSRVISLIALLSSLGYLILDIVQHISVHP